MRRDPDDDDREPAGFQTYLNPETGRWEDSEGRPARPRLHSVPGPPPVPDPERIAREAAAARWAAEAQRADDAALFFDLHARGLLDDLPACPNCGRHGCGERFCDAPRCVECDNRGCFGACLGGE